MKKLTAGIFAGILTIVTVNAADASIASKAYVDQKDTANKALIDANTTNITNLQTTVGDADNGLVKDVAALKTSVGTGGSVADQIAGALEDYTTTTDMNTELDKKADKATTLAGYGITDAYTKTEMDTKIGTLPEGVTSVTQLITNTTGAESQLSKDVAQNKTDIAAINNAETGILKQAKDYADQAETDAIAAAKTAGDAAYAVKSTETVASTNAAAIGTLSNLTTTEKTNLVGAINEVASSAGSDITELADEVHNSTTGLAATKAIADANKAAIENTTTGLAATKAIADANKAAIEDTTNGLAAAHTAIATEKTRAENAEEANADALAAFKDSFKKTASSEDGKYVLTVNQTNGEQTFYWEQIERAAATPAE